jgi:tRNA nucleotidyltransferase (CCA-adding enzyme)
LAGNSIEERCAIALMDLTVGEISSWAEWVRMPNEVRDFSEIFSDLKMLINKVPDGKYQAVDVLAWFNRADIWRKPDRGQAILVLAEKLALNVSPLLHAMRKALALNSANIIAGVAAKDRSNGERIRGAFEFARLAAISLVL